MQYSAILIFGYALDFLFTKQRKVVKRSQLPVEDVRLLLEMRLSAPAVKKFYLKRLRLGHGTTCIYNRASLTIIINPLVIWL